MSSNSNSNSNSNLKIYAICLDAYPETPELIKVMNEKKLQRSELICAGAFTCSTITSMISGCIGTEIIDGGIGYNTMYHPQFLKWRASNCLVERLATENLGVWVHNQIPWFSRVVGGKFIAEDDQKSSYREHTVDNKGIQILGNTAPFGVMKQESNTNLVYTSTNPDITLNTFLKWNFPEEKNKFYSNEKQFIKYIQHQKYNGVILTDLGHWHEYVYYKDGQIKSGTPITKQDALGDMLKWLDNWDFNEPNSIFFIFADHSHRVNSYLDPQSYVTWAYYKDNTNSSSKINPIISSNDFYYLVENKFNLKSRPIIKPKWLSNPIGSYNPNRIYAIEDGRAGSSIKDKAHAFGRCTVLNDNTFLSVTKLTDSTTFPAKIYVIISSLTNKYNFTAYLYDNLDSATNNYVDYFSIKCDGPLGDRITVKDKPLFNLTPEIISKAKDLYKLILKN